VLEQASLRSEVLSQVLSLTAIQERSSAAWTLRGTTSNARYSHRRELDDLAVRSAGIRRSAASCAALIPIRKSAAWWDLGHDERREIFEEQSRHIRIGLDYAPTVARRLHHCRDIGEPFDFLAWFEFAPGQKGAFDRMLERLRETSEWRFVDQEIDIRLERKS
jgi:chlorite dismutase